MELDTFAWTLIIALFLVFVTVTYLIYNSLTRVLAKISALESQIVELQFLIKDVNKRIENMGVQITEHQHVSTPKHYMAFNLLASKASEAFGPSLIAWAKRLIFK